MSLNVPRRTPSASSLRRSVDYENDLVSGARTSRRNSESSMMPGNQSIPQAGPAGPGAATASEKAALTSPDNKLLARPDARKGIVSLYAGVSHRKFDFDREQLSNASPFLKRLLAETEGHDGSLGMPEQETYQDLDEFAMALFQHWLHSDGRLAGPHDFHSLHHYLGLYILAQKFEVEVLENQVMDLIRHYYASENMTAPAFRIEYIYAYTHEPNAMRNFLVNTAAYRSLCEIPKTPGVFLPEPLRALIASNSDVAVDFANSAIALGKNGLQDVRKGEKCI